MNRVALHEEARTELLEAAARYESQAQGLGRDFVDRVQLMSRRIQGFPESGQRFGRRVRRLLVPRFPYALLDHATEDGLLVVAVMHLHRRPGYLRSRVE